MTDKLILDATCGNRGIWFQKHEPHTVYCDKRTAHYEMDFGDKYPGHRTIDVAPDIECDFTNLPFEDGTFNLVVIDPPHLLKQDGSWLKKQYGCYETKEEALRSVAQGIRECMRVLRTGGGVLVFKWNELDISTREIIDACGYEPLFGHRSGKKANTHWPCFMRFDDEDTTNNV